MNMACFWGGVGVTALVLATTLPAVAQESSPGLDPGSAVCGLINFAFCPQPAPPPVPFLPDPNAQAAPAPMPTAAPVPHRRHRKHVVHPKV